MKVTKWDHQGVKPDGTFYDKTGAVHAEELCYICEDSNCVVYCGGRDPITRTVKGMTIWPADLDDWRELSNDKIIEVIRENGFEPTIKAGDIT